MFYSLFFNIKKYYFDFCDLISIQFFLLPFFLFQNTFLQNLILFTIISAVFIIFFYYINIKKITNIKENNESYLYFLSHFFYFISCLLSINSCIIFINDIIKLYNQFELFYTCITILIILFLFIVINNRNEKINFIKSFIMTFLAFILIYSFLKIPKLITKNNSIIKNININFFNSIIYVFYFFFSSTYQFNFIKEKNENIDYTISFQENNFKYYLIIFFIITSLSILFCYSVFSIFPTINFTLNKTVSEILLKNLHSISIIHIMNVLIITLSFFQIYQMIIKNQTLIENIIQKVNIPYKISEIVIIAFIFLAILITNKIVLLQNIILSTFFATLSFICFIFNNITLNFCYIKNNFLSVILAIIFIVINIITIKELLI